VLEEAQDVTRQQAKAGLPWANMLVKKHRTKHEKSTFGMGVDLCFLLLCCWFQIIRGLDVLQIVLLFDK
jgi:hypothetical protein